MAVTALQRLIRVLVEIAEDKGLTTSERLEAARQLAGVVATRRGKQAAAGLGESALDRALGVGRR